MTIQPFLTTSDLIREGVDFLRIGDRKLGSLEFGTDEDYFLFLAQPNRSYTVRLDSAIDTVLGAYDLSELELFAADDDSGPGATPEFSFVTQDAPLVVVFQVDASLAGEPGGGGGGGFLGSYELTVTDDGPGFPPPPFGTDTIGDTVGTAAGIVPEAELDGRIEFAGDFDYYAVWLEANRFYEIAASGFGGFDPFLELFDEDGFLVELNDNENNLTFDSLIPFTTAVSGLYYIAVSGSDVRFDIGSYAVLVNDLGALGDPDGFDTIGDTIGTSAFVEVGETIPQAIDFSGDLDVYEIFLAAGARYRFDVFGFDFFDPELALLDAQGRELAFDDDGGAAADALLFFAPRVDGFYYLEVAGDFGDVGDYDLVSQLLRPESALTGDAMDVALLYEAGLGRIAAFSGLNFWIDRFEATTLRSVSFSFLDSAEFTAKVGDIDFISDLTLVEGLYDNVLGRPGAPAGVNFWLNQLARPEFDEADLLIAFARSPENLFNSPYVEDIELVADGTWDFV